MATITDPAAAIQKKVDVSIKDGKTFSEKVYFLELWSIGNTASQKTIEIKAEESLNGFFKQIQFRFSKDRNYVYTKSDVNQKGFDETYKGIASEFSISGLLAGSAKTVIRTGKTNSASDVTEQYNGPAERVHIKVEETTNADLKPEPKEGFVRVWDLNTGKLLNTLEGHSYQVSSVAITSDNSKIVSGSDDKKIRVWDLNTGKLLNTLEVSYQVNSLAITSDNSKIVSVSSDKKIRVWDLDNGDLLNTLRGHSHWVSSVAITSDNSKIVSGSNDNTIKIWDMNTGRLLNTLEGHSYEVSSVAITSDNSKIVSGSSDNTIKIWNLNTGKLLNTLEVSYQVSSVAITSDNSKIVSGNLYTSLVIEGELRSSQDNRTEEELDEFGIRRLVPVVGRTWKDFSYRSRDIDTGTREYFTMKGVDGMALACIGYYNTSLTYSDEDLTHRVFGGNHTDSGGSNMVLQGRCYSIGIKQNGSPSFKKEYPQHPVLKDFSDWVTLFDTNFDSVGSIRDRSIGLAVFAIASKTTKSVDFECWVDPSGLNKNGKPVNNWKPFYKISDTGDLAGDPYLENQGIKNGGDGIYYMRLDVTKKTRVYGLSVYEIDALPSVIQPLIPPTISPKIVTTKLGQSSTHLVADRWTKEDALGYHIYAHALAKFITHEKTDGPLCVSIQAPWGQGKTSLMRMVQSELDKDAASQEPTESLNKQVQRVIDQHNVKLREVMNGTNKTSADSGSRNAVQKRMYNPFKAFYKKLPFYRSSTPNSKISGQVEQDNLELREIVEREIRNPQPFNSLEVRSNIEEEVNPRLTIWFNAWAYESSEKVWSGLADSIVQQIAERLNKEERTSFLLGLHVRRHGTAKILKLINSRISSKWWQNVRPKMKKYVPFIGISLIVATLGWVNENQFWPIAGVSGLVGSVIAGSLQIFRERAQAQLDVEDEPAQESLGEYVEVPDYSKDSTFMTDVVEDVQTILKRIPNGYLPMVIFIDDLDRCSPTKVTDIIEALNLFLGGGYFTNCMFMIGMDAEMVAAALEESYSKVIDRLPKYPSYAATGWRFMDKFVQLPFVIPQAEPTDIDGYVKNLFLQDEIKGKEEKQNRETVDKINEAAREAINEITLAKHDSGMKEKQIVKNTQVEQLTKRLAEKHGLTNEKHQVVLKSEIGKHADVKELNTTINSFSYENPEIRKLILDAAPGFLGNPREVKRFMNVFRFHFFLLSARETKGLSIPSLNQLSRWIVLTLRWPTLARWIQASNQRLAQLEEFGRKCKDKNVWRTRVQKWLQPDPDAIPEIFDEELYYFFRDEGTKEPKDRLSSATKQGLF